MKNHSVSHTLSYNMNGMIFRCQCCGKFNFTYKNIFITLQRHELQSLKKCLERLSGSAFNYPHPHGNKATLFFDGNKGLLGFTEYEKEEVLDLINQAFLIDEAKNIVQEKGK